MTNIAEIPIVDFFQPTTIRLISTAYIDEPAMSPLADNPDDLALLEELEGLTSARSGLPEFLPNGVQEAELLGPHHGYGWTYVNAAFCYTRAAGNRFNGPDRGAWYAAWGDNCIQTAQQEVAWHLTQELHATGIYENITSYRELKASFATRFHDLTNANLPDVLNPDPAIGHQSGQALAGLLLAAQSNGLLYPSARHQGGKCLAAFRPHLVQNITQGDTWIFEWNGEPEPKISAA